MRRNELAVTDFVQKLAVLERCDVMRIGFLPCADEKTPYIVPVHFGLATEGEALTIYFHGAKEGRKINCYRENSFVSFEADRLIDTFGKKKACSWTADFESVMGEGQLRMLESVEEKTAALNAIMAHYNFPGRPEYSEKMLDMTAAFALDVSEWVAKVKINKRDA